jgi:putative membrane protein insertion efficiency factor
MKKIAIFLIMSYQKIFSNNDSLYHTLGFRKKNTCVFYPSCSEYGLEAFKKYSFLEALVLLIRRIVRCHPWQTTHYDPLP